MKEATMLYKKGTMIKTNDGEFDYIIVDADEIDSAKKQGYHLTQAEALNEKLKRTTKAKTDELD